MSAQDDIAIIGMEAMFASAPDVSTFWSNILGKVDAIADAPANWLGDQTIFDPDAGNDSSRIYTKRGGFLGDVARFDPRPFGTMPVALSGAEPDQFLALKLAVAALADAGYGGDGFDGERTGIILGHGVHAHRGNVNGIQHAVVLVQTVNLLRAVFPAMTDAQAATVEAMLAAKLPRLNVDSVPGLVPNMMTGRIANRLDLMGPNYIIDAACASSTLAVESAITELRSGRADIMLAGGINTSTSPLVYMVFCKLGALSRRSQIRPFDRGADGTLLGEGGGIVVLKRLADAQRAGDRIYAVIKGSGASSDGRANGLMAPRLEGEVLAMRRAYESTGIDPATIGLVEMHGTGIPLGDQLEVKALHSIFGGRRGPSPDVAMGSVKSMIGHCIPAAGMASLAKMAMALDQKILPPTLAETVSGELGLERTPFFLNTEALPWIHRRGVPRRAAINAFGFGGINTHLILEEAPDSGAPPAAFGLRAPRPAELFLLAADTRESLRAAAEALGRSDAVSVRALARETAAKSASGGSQRLAVIAADLPSLRRKLQTAVEKLAKPDLHRLRDRAGIFFADESIGGKVAFLFPGENSQYAGMLRDLALASPLVRDKFDRLESLFHGERDVPHRVLLFPPPLGLSDTEEAALETRLRQVDNGSEAVFFADQAIFSVLRAFGVRPDFIVGHSTGENAAIIAANLVQVSDAGVDDYIRRMNAIFNGIEAGKLVPNGMLLAVGALAREAADAVLARYPDAQLTMDNCPNQLVVYGPAPVVTAISAELSAQGAVCTTLPLAWAYHTQFVAPMADAFVALLEAHALATPLAPVYSCASAGPFPEDADGIRTLLREQYVSRVRFTETIRRLHDDGARIFVEVGPASHLTGFVGDILRGRPHLALASDNARGAGYEQLLSLVGQLFVHRVPLDLAPLHAAPERTSEAPPSREPVLESAVPFINLTAAESERLRTMLLEALPSVPTAGPIVAPAIAPQPATAPPTPAFAGSHPPGAPPAQGTHAPEMARLLTEHFHLMNDFLINQEAVTRRAVERQRS